MYKSFSIKNFRCFKNFSIDNLERMNLIAGANNVGKTALLEAIFIHGGGTRIEVTIRINAIRGRDEFQMNQEKASENIWVPLFYRYDDEAVIEIAAKDSEDQIRKLKLKFIQPDSATIQQDQPSQTGSLEEESMISTETIDRGLELEQELSGTRKTFQSTISQNGIRLNPLPDPVPFPCHFFAARIRPSAIEEAERYGHLEAEGLQDVILDLLKIIEPRLKRLAMIVTSRVPVLHGDIGIGRLIPLAFMGDGMGRLANLAIGITNASGGVVLIDEIENGIHHSVMTEVWLGIAKLACQSDVQIFATTHSFECINAAHQAFKKSGQYDFRLHRLDQVDDSIEAVTLDEEALEVATQMGMEVR